MERKEETIDELIEKIPQPIWFWDLSCEPEGWLFFGRDIGEETIYPDVKHGIKEIYYSKTPHEAIKRAIKWVQDNCDEVAA